MVSPFSFLLSLRFEEVWNGGNTRWKNGSNSSPEEREKNHQWKPLAHHQTVIWGPKNFLRVNLLRFQDLFVTVVESIQMWVINYKMTFGKHFSFTNILIFGSVEVNIEQVSQFAYQGIHICVYLSLYNVYVEYICVLYIIIIQTCIVYM